MLTLFILHLIFYYFYYEIRRWKIIVVWNFFLKLSKFDILMKCIVKLIIQCEIFKKWVYKIEKISSYAKIDKKIFAWVDVNT